MYPTPGTLKSHKVHVYFKSKDYKNETNLSKFY